MPMILAILIALTSKNRYPLYEIDGIGRIHSSIGQAERVFDRGLPVTGGHPQGARIWRLSRKS